MSAAVDSTKVFEARVKELGLKGLLDKFTANGWTKYSAFAFAANFATAMASDQEFKTKILLPLFSQETLDAGPVPQSPHIKRLFWEAYTLTAADMARRANPSSGDTHDKLPNEERAHRMSLIKDDLKGLSIKEELEPSDALVDKFCEMQTAGRLRYVHWEELTRRDDEVLGIKKNFGLGFDSKGKLEVQMQEDDEMPADLGTDLRLKNALQRRGIAMQVARLLSFDEHEKIVRWYQRELEREQPPKYNKVSISQVLEADLEIFRCLARLTAGGLPYVAGQALPLDAHIETVLKDPRIVFRLNPLPRSAGSAGEPKGEASNDQAMKRKNQEIQRLQSENKRLRKGNAKGKGKGSKDKAKSKKVMPKELMGMENSYKGKPLCYGYNMRSGCDQDVDSSGQCRKGLHLCARRGCHGTHPAFKCPKRD